MGDEFGKPFTAHTERIREVANGAGFHGVEEAAAVVSILAN